MGSVTIGNSVKAIGIEAFSGCSALQSFTSGESVRIIGEKAFSECTELTSFVSLATTPPVCGPQALDDINKSECILYVPTESIEDYQQAEVWKEFYFINVANIAAIGNEVVKIEHTADGIRIDNADQMPVGIYTIDGKLWKYYPSYQGEDINLEHGLYIIRVGSTSQKIKF